MSAVQSGRFACFSWTVFEGSRLGRGGDGSMGGGSGPISGWMALGWDWVAGSGRAVGGLVKDPVIEDKTPEITIEQARTLLASVDTGQVIGLRDRAILATLAYTACRAGAVAKLRLQDFQHDGQQYVPRFQEKGGKSREIPVRHDLEGFILAYVEAAGIAGEAKDSPLFRVSNGRSRTLAGKPLGTERICELVKRRLKDAGLPSRLSPHSFRVTAITSLLEQGVPMEDVQYLAGHAEPRTTTLYDRRKKRVTRNIVERIPI